LRRVLSGRFDVKDAIPFEEVLKMSPAGLAGRVLPFLQLTQPA
jgi:hypothetical protein